jgi:predicted protein tyrosine phosphatase
MFRWADTGRRNVLFVCGRNKRRSRTAHEVFRKDLRMVVRSAGFSAQSPHILSADDVAWADVIFVMEDEHGARLRRAYRALSLPDVVVLHIPDEYGYMDAELIEMLQGGVEGYFGREYHARQRRHRD